MTEKYKKIEPEFLRILQTIFTLSRYTAVILNLLHHNLSWQSIHPVAQQRTSPNGTERKRTH
jgi:hypothetical protein